MNTLVSVVVPVYNTEKYLAECIDSIINQTHRELEIILVDDGSNDSSGHMCDEYAKCDSRIKVIHKQNEGLSEARNSGLDYITGEYVYFCDSDDFVDNDTIEVLLSQVKSDAADMVFFNAIPFSDEGQHYNANAYKRKKDYSVGTGKNIGFRELVLDEYMPCVPLHFYKTNFLLEQNIRFKKGIIGEDELFSFWTYYHAERVTYVSRRLYHRRLREGSIMTTGGNAKRKFLDYFVIYREMKNVFNREQECRFVKEYLVRIAKSIVLVYSQLNKDEQENVQVNYLELKKDILQNKAYGDPSLLIRLWSRYIGIGISGVRKYIRMKKYE